MKTYEKERKMRSNGKEKTRDFENKKEGNGKQRKRKGHIFGKKNERKK